MATKCSLLFESLGIPILPPPAQNRLNTLIKQPNIPIRESRHTHSPSTCPTENLSLSKKDSILCQNRQNMGWLRLVGSIKLQVTFAKEPYKRDDILQKRHVILSTILTVATPYPPLSKQTICQTDQDMVKKVHSYLRV